MEEANEDNWSPSPWFPNQQMPDSVLVNKGAWQVMLLADNRDEVEPISIDSKILTMNPAPDGNMYMVYDNELSGLDAQLINPELKNVWDNIVTVEERPLSTGMFMPTPLAQVNEDDKLMLSYS